MLTIYHYRSTRSVRVIWACEELSIPYHLEIIDPSEEYRRSDEWRALSPTGRIPAMADDGFTMFESGAMLQYVLDRYGGGRLVPEPGTADSAHYLQWSWFAEATCSRPSRLHPPCVEYAGSGTPPGARRRGPITGDYLSRRGRIRTPGHRLPRCQPVRRCGHHDGIHAHGRAACEAAGQRPPEDERVPCAAERTRRLQGRNRMIANCGCAVAPPSR